MQGKAENMHSCTDKIKRFQRKLDTRKAIEVKLEMFPLTSNTCINKTLPIKVDHLTRKKEKLSAYFPSLNPEPYYWIRNPLMEISEFGEEELTGYIH